MSTLATLLTALLSTSTVARSGPADAALLPQDPPPPTPPWSGGLTFGAIFTEGNTITDSANAAFNAQRRGEKDRLTLDAFFNWAQQAGDVTSTPLPDKDDTELTQRNYGAGAKYDYFSSPQLYYFANGSGKVDDVALLDLRYILGGGLGYQWKETEALKWGTEVGLSYVDENFVDDAADADFAALRLASNLGWKLSASSSFEQVAEVLPSLDDSEDVIAKIDNRLKFNITGKWIAQIQYVLDFDGSVPAGNDETDHRVVVGVGWSFGS